MFNLRRLDLNLLTVFESIYESGSVSAAAERIALSQSATSHALSRLREACNDELFVRAPQGLSPTPVAREMYPTIKQALEALRTTLAEASGFDPARSQRRFHVSIPHPMGPFYALALRKAVASVAPGIVLTFKTVSQPVNLEDELRDGVVDIAIDWLPIGVNPFVNTKLFEDRLVILARNDHPSINESMTLEDLLKEEFVGPHRRRDIEHLPPALKKFSELAVNEVVRVNELLENASYRGEYRSVEPLLCEHGGQNREAAGVTGARVSPQATPGAHLYGLARDPPHRHRPPLAA
jgi:DNA-binding transcriptional LysR family regulator